MLIKKLKLSKFNNLSIICLNYNDDNIFHYLLENCNKSIGAYIMSITIIWSNKILKCQFILLNLLTYYLQELFIVTHLLETTLISDD